MTAEFFFKGLIIGFSIAAPVGPIGLLCIRKTLVGGPLVGFVSGLGAATADGLYGLMAGIGLSIITNFLIDQQMWLQFIGGAFLCYLGIKIFISKLSITSVEAKGGQLYTAYATTFLLTLTNPVTVLSFLAIFSGVGISHSNDVSLAGLLLVMGIFFGSALWWLILSSITGILKNRLNVFSLNYINRVSGSILLFFGLWSFYDLVKG